MRQVTASDAKAMILRLLDKLVSGRPVARLVPARGYRTLEGSFEGRARTAVDGDELLSIDVAWNAV
jgi:antitoxin (DNA-binding transcriptional repressor) of toxin-antitoxin stability system